jgi:hypothetical protein
MLDTQKLIAEIAERHHVRVDPDDPVFVVVTVNQRVMEDTVREMLKVMEATLARFDASIERAENRAGRVLAQSVKESGDGFAVWYTKISVLPVSKRMNWSAQFIGLHSSVRSGSGPVSRCSATTVLCAGEFLAWRLTVPR